MINTKMWQRVLKLSTLALLLVQFSAFAQPLANYPSRPLRIVLPFAPGAATDFTARIIGPKLTEELGKQIVIDNRAGAGGLIGVEIVARSNPDGHTLLHSNVGAIAINPWVHPSVQPLRDLVPVSLIVDVPSMLVANLSFPPNTLQEFIGYVRANPGRINHSSGSIGLVVASRLQMESFMRVVGIKMVHIGYKGGAGQAVVGLLSNEVQVMFVSAPSVISFVKQKRLKGFGVTAETRVSAAPDVPTLPELGYPAMKFGTWQGIFVPKGTPPAIVDRLFTTVVKVMAFPDVKERLADGGVYSIVSKSPTEFFEFVKAETNRFGKALKEAESDTTAETR